MKTIYSLMQKNRALLIMVAALVVFVVTYLLVLPAFTLDEEEAREQGGITVAEEAATPEAEDQSTKSTDQALPNPDEGKKAEAGKSEIRKAADQDAEETEGDQMIAASKALTFEGEGYAVSASCDATAGLPEDTELAVQEINKKDDKDAYKDYYQKALAAVRQDAEENQPKGQQAKGENLVESLRFAHFYDISLTAGDRELEPEDLVGVSIAYEKALTVANKDHLKIIHFVEDPETGKVDTQILDPENVDLTLKKDKLTEASFQTESFSGFGIVYTVDFHWNVDGEQYDYSMEGGKSASLKFLLQTLHITEPADTEAFLDGIDSVKFSDPKLIHVQQITEDTTIGALIKDAKLKPEYSADLTKSDITEYEKTELTAPDWALISLKPFDTEETLTVEMKNGEKFVVKVTDAQEDPLGLDGKAYAIVNTKNNTSTAMKAEISGNRLQGQGVSLGQNGNTPTCSDNADVWVFEAAGAGKYFIRSGDQYLKINGANRNTAVIELVNRDNADPITIVEDNGKYRFLNDSGVSINNYGGIFWVGDWNNSDEWMMFRTPYDPNKPATRVTEDTRAVGLTINLFDYGPDDGDNNLDHVNNSLAAGSSSTYWNAGINQYSDLKFFSYGTGYEVTCGINNFTGSSPNHKAAQGIVQTTLSDGYPSLQNGQSLDYLFDMNPKNGKTIYPNVNHLFWMEDGKYSYDSDESYAYYNKGTKDFKVYNTTFQEEGATDTAQFKVGFFPFNDYDSRYQCIHGDSFNFNDCKGKNNPHGVNDEVGHYNHHFGLSMSGTFKIVKNKDMTFHFSGDDDLWVFVDDVLVLDIGGIHNPISGDINFGTTDGSVTVSPNVVAVDGNNNYLAPNTIKAAFEKAGKTWDGSDGSYHEIKVFYLERGGMYSNLEMEINLPLVPSGNVSLNKTDDSLAALPGAKFTLYTDDTCEHPLSFKSENASAVSNDDGVISFSSLPVGTYYMKETSAPDGYRKDPEVYKVMIQDKNTGTSTVTTLSGKPVNRIVNSENTIALSVNKIWQNQNRVSITPSNDYSATFQVYRLRSYTQPGETVTGSEDTLQIRHVKNDDGWGTFGSQTYKYLRGRTVTINYDYHGQTSTNNKRQYRYTTDGGNYWTYKNLDNTGNFNVTIPNSGQMLIEFYDTNNIVTYTIDDGATPPTPVTDQDDPTFNCAPITLTNGKTQGDFYSGMYTGTANEGRFPVQATINGIKYTYKYYIKETAKNPSASQIVYLDGEGQVVSDPSDLKTDTDSTQTIINKVPNGSIKLRKWVTIGGVSPEDEPELKAKADGDYTFEIAGIEGTPTVGITKNVRIQISNGKAVKAWIDNTETSFDNAQNQFVEIADLIPGDYTITEGVSGNDVWLSSVSGGKGNGNIDTRSITVTATAGQSGDAVENQGKATFTNNYSPDSEEDIAHISIKKSFVGLPAGTVFDDSFKITVKVNNKTYELTSNPTDPAVTFDGSEFPVCRWTVSVKGMLKDAHVEVQEINAGYPAYDVSTSINGVDNTSSYSGVVSSSTVIQAFSPKIYEPNNKKDFNVTDTKIFMALLTDGHVLVISKNKLSLSERAAIEELLAGTGTQKMKEGNWGKELPPYYYTVSENRPVYFKGAKITYNNNNVHFDKKCQWTHTAEVGLTYQPGDPADFNFVNNYTDKTVGLDIHKVNAEGMSEPLPGAGFEIRKINPVTGMYTDDIVLLPATTGEDHKTGNDGKAAFGNLKEGYYEVKEVILPAGYVRTGDGLFYIKVSNGSLSLIEKDDSSATGWKERASEGNLLFQVASGESPAIITYGNEPGKPLPFTGGPGTTLFYILGSILLLGSGVLLVARWRMRRSFR